MGRARVVWSEQQQRFVPADGGAAAPRRAPSKGAADATRVQPAPPGSGGSGRSSGRAAGAAPASRQADPRKANPRQAAPGQPAPRQPAPRQTDSRQANQRQAAARQGASRQADPRKPGARQAGAPAASPAQPAGRRRRRRGRRLLVTAAVMVLLVPMVFLVIGWVLFGRIDRVATDGVLSTGGGGGTNYLIVGTDSREGIDPDDPTAGAFLDGEFGGVRTDTIMLLRVGGGSTALLSIPRDLWVRNAVTGEAGRINSTYQTSPAALIATVQQSLGIPVHRYLEIGFPSFGSLVDSLGGITVDFPNPARDDMSGLLVEQAGPVRLDGDQALAYVRSRQYTELVDGTWRTDPTADIGRTERQRAFITNLFGSIGGTRNPFTLVQLGRTLGDGLRIDDAMSYPDALRFAWQMRGLAPESVALPVFGRTTTGGAAVLELDVGAAEVLAGFGATGPPAPPVG